MSSGYVDAGELRMYYEERGAGRPTLLLHGAYMTVEMLDPLFTALARTRRVIAVEQQGHGRTADVDRPFSYEQMADDTAAFARGLGLDAVDVVGYSLGGGVALQLAIRHGSLVRKLVLASAAASSDGMPSVALEMFPTITPELFAGSPIEQAYKDTAPYPEAFPTLV